MLESLSWERTEEARSIERVGHLPVVTQFHTFHHWGEIRCTANLRLLNKHVDAKLESMSCLRKRSTVLVWMDDQFVLTWNQRSRSERIRILSEVWPGNYLCVAFFINSIENKEQIVVGLHHEQLSINLGWMILDFKLDGFHEGVISGISCVEICLVDFFALGDERW